MTSGHTSADSMDKLRWQCRRGMLELDYLLAGFLEQRFPVLNPEDQRRFVRLLDLEDQLLLDWLTGQVVPADEGFRKLIGMMRRE